VSELEQHGVTVTRGRSQGIHLSVQVGEGEDGRAKLDRTVIEVFGNTWADYLDMTWVTSSWHQSP
jgi:hypothetical protein